MKHDGSRMARRIKPAAGCVWPVNLRLARVLVALTIMFVAVLPHATLAASARHDAMPMAATAPHHGHAGSVSGATTPCHEDGQTNAAGKRYGASCCILGCGLLMAGPAPGPVSVPTPWRTATLLLRESGDEIALEPAERPPRRAIAV